MICSMCEEQPATTTWGLPVCQPCYDSLEVVQAALKQMEAADPKLKVLGERVEQAARRLIEEAAAQDQEDALWDMTRREN